jgi:nucleotide-binding universal stress UspA family protein
MFKIEISGKTTEELTANAAAMIALLGGTSVKAVTVLSASDQARLRGDALVVSPSGKGDEAKPQTAAEKKAAKKAADEAAAAAAEEAGDDQGDDPLDENGDEAEALTNADVKALLIEVRAAYPKDATIISTIVKEYGKSAKISDVDDKYLPKIADHCRALLKKAKK